MSNYYKTTSGSCKPILGSSLLVNLLSASLVTTFIIITILAALRKINIRCVGIPTYVLFSVIYHYQSFVLIHFGWRNFDEVDGINDSRKVFQVLERMQILAIPYLTLVYPLEF